jgi:DNA helicase-2/ATP-dependent DNA helicase PcrA
MTEPAMLGQGAAPPGLNPQQAEAAMHAHGPLVIFAGAGSGKTKTLTQRCVNLIIVHGIRPDNILLVTFTNKAANEMKERMEKLLGKGQLKGLWSGTFHSVCARMLRTYAEHIGRRKDFIIYDDHDQEVVCRQIVNELKLDKKIYAPGKMAEYIQQCKQCALRPADWEQASEEGQAPEGLPDMLIAMFENDDPHFCKIWNRYERWMHSCNALDFEDLIVLTMRLAEGDTEVGATLRRRFSHVLVDEFQDTNATQYRLIKALGSSRNVCVVGDDAQSIYSWRGAKVENIRGFHKEFEDATVVKLEQNYRSTANIVGAASGVIAASEDCVPKKLWTASEPGSRVSIVQMPDDRQEAKFLAARVKMLVAAGHSLSGMAILYRTHVQSRVIEEELRMWSVMYRVVGGFRFYDRKEIKDIISYLRLIANKDSDVDLLRILNEPPRGIGAGTAKRIGEVASARGIGLWGALPYMAQSPELRPKERDQIGRFRSMMEELSAEADTCRASELAVRVIMTTGYKTMWLDEARELLKEGQRVKAEEAEERAANCDGLVETIAYYERQTLEGGEIPTLRGYLEQVSLVMEREKDESVEKLTLMTCHAAKGTEYPFVWVVGAEEGRFPGRDIDKKEIAESQRLFYVAVTRAKKQLWITHADVRWLHGQREYQEPSRFLKDIPEQHCVRMTLLEYEELERQMRLRPGPSTGRPG